MGLKRGDLVTVSAPGDYGKPRPALVVQADYALGGDAVTFLPLTSDLLHAPDLRVGVLPDSANGLLKPSEIMVDRIQTIAAERVGKAIGRLDVTTMGRVDAALLIFLGLV